MKPVSREDNKDVLIRALLRLLLFPFVGYVIIFLPAGTLTYWQGWCYLGVFWLGVVFVSGYLLIADPELLRRRMARRETRTTQKWVMPVVIVLLLALWCGSASDWRLHPAAMPEWGSVVADLVQVVAFWLIFVVLRANRFAGSTIGTAAGQHLIDHGPYGCVRHPLYSGMLIMWLGTPPALGSWWGLLAALGLLVCFTVRARDEEHMLLEELPGYREYCRRVRWRFVPGVW